MGSSDNRISKDVPARVVVYIFCLASLFIPHLVARDWASCHDTRLETISILTLTCSLLLCSKSLNILYIYVEKGTHLS